VTATVEPKRVLFADPLLAELRVSIDESVVDPDSVQLTPHFGGFRQLGSPELERLDLGRTTVFTYRYALQCVDRGCAPGDAEKTVKLPFSLLQYADPKLGAVTKSVLWPDVTIVSRLESSELSDPTMEPESDIAPVSYRVSPLFLGWLLVGVGAALALAVGALAAWWILRSRPAEAPAAEPEVVAGTALEQALEQVDGSLEGEEEERRTALDALAVALDEDGLSELARLARRLGWSEPVPEASAMSELAAAARRAAGEAA
jgi:hypothetical protein